MIRKDFPDEDKVIIFKFSALFPATFMSPRMTQMSRRADSH